MARAGVAALSFTEGPSDALPPLRRPSPRRRATRNHFRGVASGLCDPLARHQLAILDYDEGQLADAENHWRTILADTPSFTPARLGLAELYLQQIRWTELVNLLNELESHAPLDAAVLRARLHLARQQFTAVRQLLEMVIRQAPHALMPYVVLSHVLLQSGDLRAAEPLLCRIVEMDPG